MYPRKNFQRYIQCLTSVAHEQTTFQVGSSLTKRRIEIGTKHRHQNYKSRNNSHESQNSYNVAVEVKCVGCHSSVVDIRVQVVIHIELFIFEFRNVQVKDLTRSILNLRPEFIKHSVSLRDECNVTGISGVWCASVPLWWLSQEQAVRDSNSHKVLPWEYLRNAEFVSETYESFHCNCFHSKHESETDSHQPQLRQWLQDCKAECQ